MSVSTSKFKLANYLYNFLKIVWLFYIRRYLSNFITIHSTSTVCRRSIVVTSGLTGVPGDTKRSEQSWDIEFLAKILLSNGPLLQAISSLIFDFIFENNKLRIYDIDTYNIITIYPRRKVSSINSIEVYNFIVLDIF